MRDGRWLERDRDGTRNPFSGTEVRGGRHGPVPLLERARPRARTRALARARRTHSGPQEAASFSRART